MDPDTHASSQGGAKPQTCADGIWLPAVGCGPEQEELRPQAQPLEVYLRELDALLASLDEA